MCMLDVDVFLLVEMVVGLCMGWHRSFFLVYTDKELEASKTLFGNRHIITASHLTVNISKNQHSGAAMAIGGLSTVTMYWTSKYIVDRLGAPTTVATSLTIYSLKCFIYYFLRFAFSSITYSWAWDWHFFQRIKKPLDHSGSRVVGRTHRIPRFRGGQLFLCRCGSSRNGGFYERPPHCRLNGSRFSFLLSFFRWDSSRQTIDDQAKSSFHRKTTWSDARKCFDIRLWNSVHVPRNGYSVRSDSCSLYDCIPFVLQENGIGQTV